jgi:hypothetical protein
MTNANLTKKWLNSIYLILLVLTHNVTGFIVYERSVLFNLGQTYFFYGFDIYIPTCMCIWLLSICGWLPVIMLAVLEDTHVANEMDPGRNNKMQGSDGGMMMVSSVPTGMHVM